MLCFVAAKNVVLSVDLQEVGSWVTHFAVRLSYKNGVQKSKYGPELKDQRDALRNKWAPAHQVNLTTGRLRVGNVGT